MDAASRPRKGKPVARRGRKATGPTRSAGLQPRRSTIRNIPSPSDRYTTRAVAFTLSVLGLVQDRVGVRNERGATAVEYGLMVGLIAVVIIVAVTALGGQLTGLFESVTDGLDGATAPAATTGS